MMIYIYIYIDRQIDRYALKFDKVNSNNDSNYACSAKENDFTAT